MRRSSDANAPIVVSMVGAALVTAQFVAGKAARDAIYLGHLSAASLPSIVVATAVVSILLAFVSSRVLHWKAPAAVVPSAFVVSAALFVVEWALVELSPVAAARLLYLHVSGLGPMLGSGFWLIVTERFDPHTARQRFGEIAGAGTAGGLLGALAAERLGVLVGVSAMLPSLAAINLVCAWQIFSLARSGEVATHVREEEMAPELMVDSPQPGLRVLGGTPYLRQLAALVLLGSIAAAFVDYALKAQAGAAFASEAELLRFFAGFYAATSLITFVVQMSSSRIALEKFGLSFASSTPSLALFVGGLGALAAPGLAAAAIARAGEAVFRGSLFRSGYEVFYTPISPKQKRAAKSIIDVGFDRLGDAFGGSAIRAIQLLPLAIQYNTVVVFAVACSGLAMLVASRLSRGYVKTLEQSLLNRAVELELSDIEDTLTKTTVLRSLPSRTSSSVYGDTSVLPSASVTRELSRPGGERGADAAEPSPAPGTRHGTELPGARAAAGGDGRHRASGTPDPELTDLVDLRSRDVERVRRVLRRDRGLPAFLVPQTIALLAWEPVAPDAIFALKKVAEERVGELIDALIDPNQPFAVRRRLARVFSICVSQRAVDGLLLGLDDLRFEVRLQCGRSLAAIVDRNPMVHVDKARVFEVVEREVAVGRPVWESRQLLDRLDDPDQRSFVDEFLEDRANQSLAHVFTLLTTVLPSEALRTAFRALHTDDQRLRGTALEYLEGVLPPVIRQRLWPFLEDRRSGPSGTRTRDEIVADLLRSNQSIMLNLEELKRKSGSTPVLEPEDRRS